MKPIIENEKYKKFKTEFKLILVILDSILKHGFDPDIHNPILKNLFRFY